MDYNDLYTVVGLVEASCKTIGEDHPRPCLADRRTSNHPGHPRVSGHNESFPKPDFLGTVYCVTYCNKKRGDALFPWIGPLYAVYIIVYWWCITRPSYTHYEHIYIYIYITWGPVPFLKPLLGRNGRAAASCQVDNWDDSTQLLGFRWCSSPAQVRTAPRQANQRTGRGGDGMGWERGTATGYEFYHVLPCYTMFYHVLPCYTMLYHVIPCYTMLYTE
jgi:hypothetical protein